MNLQYLRDLLVYEMHKHLVDLRNAEIRASGRMEGLLGYEGPPGARLSSEMQVSILSMVNDERFRQRFKGKFIPAGTVTVI